MHEADTKQARLTHIDAAKGLSIFLVVYWHAVDNRLVLNEALWMLRMPLFFFVSGLFASKVLDHDWRSFLIHKVGNIFYLYILWTFLVFGSTIFVAQLFGPDPIDWFRPFLLFIDPPRTLWFMYALGAAFLIAKLIRPLPWIPVFIGLFALYCWSIASGEWRTIPFYEKLIRLFPFFYLALNIRSTFLQMVEKAYKYGWLAFPVFIAAALVVFQSQLSSWGPVTFLVGLLGVTGTVMLFRWTRGGLVERMAAAIGKRSLLVYVMHRIPLFYLEHAMDFAGIPKSALTMSILAVIVTWVCLLVGEKVILPLFSWMFDAPWLKPTSRLSAKLVSK